MHSVDNEICREMSIETRRVDLANGLFYRNERLLTTKLIR